MGKIERAIYRLFRVFGLVVCTQKTIDRDTLIIRQKYLIIGREIGELNACRFARERCSPEKFQEFASKFDFGRLDKEYPFNPLVEKENGKVKSAAESINS